jgi:hypothetical protein
MLILIVLHICLAANGRTLCSRARAIKDRLMLYSITSCVGTTRRGTRRDGTHSPAPWWASYALSPDATYGTAQGVVWSDLWVSFLVILFQSFILDA